MTDFPLLTAIATPADLRRLALGQLPALCAELRGFILRSVAQTGGHLASSLGVVELTVAIHYVFDTPADSLVWDVGHQAYPHKILTGRQQAMDTLRQQHGLSGFPKRGESEYDDFGVGHSSTSISAALGMAIANQLHGKQHQHIAVIGDGAMTAGMAFEAIHHAGSVGANLLIILNDNDMSISPNVGGLSSYLSDILTSDFYHDIRDKGKQVLQHFPPFNDLAKRAEDKVKRIAGNSNLFEDFGFAYTGPEDGHNVLDLVVTLQALKSQKGPRLLHIKTQKGKGYAKAEAEPIAYHGVGKFDLQTGLVKSSTAPTSVTYTEVFSQWICQTASQHPELVAITPAMREGSGLVKFSQLYANRYFDVAIAEQHALTLAAGMACKGIKPVVAIYSTFLQRAYDQLIHDIAIQNLDVTFAVDRAGIVGEDGATHSGAFDLAFCRCIPNLLILTPANGEELSMMLDFAYHHTGPALVRYPKGPAHLAEHTTSSKPEPVVLGKAQILRLGESGKAEKPKQAEKSKNPPVHLAILVFGTLLNEVLAIANTHDATLVNMRFVKPLDTALLREIGQTHSHVLVIEEGAVLGGIGETVSECLHQQSATVQVKLLGLADHFPEAGTRNQVLQTYALSAESIEETLVQWLKNPRSTTT